MNPFQLKFSKFELSCSLLNGYNKVLKSFVISLTKSHTYAYVCDCFVTVLLFVTTIFWCRFTICNKSYVCVQPLRQTHYLITLIFVGLSPHVGYRVHLL